MPSLLTGGPWAVAKGALDALTANLGSVLKDINTELDGESIDWRMPTEIATGPELMFRTSPRVDPADCPAVRIPITTWSTDSETSGVDTQGVATHTFDVEVTIAAPGDDELNGSGLGNEAYLARACLAWDEALVAAIRDRSTGIWNKTPGASIMTANRIRVERYEYRSKQDGEVIAVRLVQSWTVVQDARY